MVTVSRAAVPQKKPAEHRVYVLRAVVGLTAASEGGASKKRRVVVSDDEVEDVNDDDDFTTSPHFKSPEKKPSAAAPRVPAIKTEASATSTKRQLPWEAQGASPAKKKPAVEVCELPYDSGMTPCRPRLQLQRRLL